MTFADPHETLWVQDDPWWERPREFLTPEQDLQRNVLLMRGSGFRIVVKRRRRGEKAPDLPRLTDVWYAKRKRKFVPSGTITIVLAERMWREQGRACGYCKRPTYIPGVPSDGDPRRIQANIDHREPTTRGGTWKRYNLISACKFCNTAKNDLPEAVYRKILERYPPDPDGRFMSRVKSAAKRWQAGRLLVAREFYPSP